MPDPMQLEQEPTVENAKAAAKRPREFVQRTRAEQLAAVLDDRIRSGELKSGESVGTLESLRSETGFAYSTVSEAVRLLRDRGILDIRPGRGGGLFVATTGPVVRMRHTLLSVEEEPGTVADAIELREHLELLIDLAAARHRTAEDIIEIRALLALMEDAPTWDAFVHRNWALHERIAAICPNAMARAVYVGTLGHLATTSADTDIVDVGRTEYRRRRQQLHADLVDAIVSGDETAIRTTVIRHNTLS